jgi:hypothetical protein
VLTGACLGDGDESGRMGAHYSKDFVISLTKLLQEAGYEAAFSEVVMDDELGYPAHLSALVGPAAGKCITREGVINMDGNIVTRDAAW